ncbi:MAG: nucleotide exchange factor GrpE [Patescibacteria group bacterium]
MKKTSSKQPNQVPDLQNQVQALDASWKRALADYQNLLRRVDSDKREFTKMSNANLIARLLPSLDIIEMASSHSKDLGVQMAAKQFGEALTQEGLQVIQPATGEVFNSTFHECTETVENPDQKAENTISELVLKGYRIGDYVLRPARVKAFKYQIST